MRHQKCLLPRCTGGRNVNSMGGVRKAGEFIALLPWRRIRFIGLVVVAALCAAYCLLGLAVLIGAGWVHADDWALHLSFVGRFWVLPLVLYGALAYVIAPLVVYLVGRIPP